jgi:hypothetical protein
MLDFDLAELYDVQTKHLKEAVRRNHKRFPEDFFFILTKTEFHHLRSQIATSNRGGTRYMPYAFTEQGVAMLSSILRSKKAIASNILIMRAFVLMRQFALSHKELTAKLKALEKKYDQKFGDITAVINYLLKKDKLLIKQQKRRPIGFRTNTRSK